MAPSGADGVFGEAGCTVDREAFVGLVREALVHLNDLPLLTTHPLCDLMPAHSPPTPSALRQLLIGTIEELRPPDLLPKDSSRWRQYRSLYLRYIDGASPSLVTRELGVGERQARREHREALEAFAGLLQTKLTGAGVEGVEPSLVDVEPTGALETSLETELVRVEAESAAAGPTDVRAEIEAVADLARRLASVRGVRVELVECAPTTTPAARAIVRQVFLNLLSCLIHLGHHTRLRISSYDAQDGARASFCLDSSDGEVSDHDLRVEPRLVSASQLVASQGGRIEVAVAASGSVRIDLMLPSDSAKVVLLVDDNPDISRLFRHYLQGTRYHLIHARNAPGALELISARAPQAIILDLMMPVQDGWDLFGELRSNPLTAGIPVIACSILPEEELALSLGANGFLAKPVTRTSLLEALSRLERDRDGGHPGSTSGI